MKKDMGGAANALGAAAAYAALGGGAAVGAFAGAMAGLIRDNEIESKKVLLQTPPDDLAFKAAFNVENNTQGAAIFGAIIGFVAGGTMAWMLHIKRRLLFDLPASDTSQL